MIRLPWLLLVWFCLALAGLHAAPARPLYEPPPPPAAPKVVLVDLNNTAWVGKYNAAIRTFIFEADGTLSYRSGAAKVKGAGIKNRGSWKVVGNQLFFEHFINPNQKLMTFQGTIQDANTIVGEATYLLLNKKDNQTLQRTTFDAK